MSRNVFSAAFSLVLLSVAIPGVAQQHNSHSPLDQYAESSRARANVAAREASAVLTSATMQMPLVAPIFIEDDDFTSMLVMVNSSSVNTFADVVLTGMDGGEIARKRVQFTSHSQRHIEISALLHETSSSATTGRVEILQSPALKGMSVLAQLLLTYQGSSKPNYIDEEISMPSASGSQTLRAVTDGTDGSPILAITSLSSSTQRLTVECLFEQGRIFSKFLDLFPGETLVTEACIARTMHGAAFQIARDGEGKGPRGSVGIALASDAIPGSFAAFGLVPHEDRGGKFFSGMVFDDPKMLVSSTTIFPGVPVGATNLLPAGNFVPELALANFSLRDAHVRVQYVHNSAGAAVADEVKSVVVPARSTSSFRLQNLPGDPELKSSFLLITEAAPGDIMSKVVSRSDSALREVELLGRDEQEHENGGSHPWTLQGETDSTLLLFNHTSEAQAVEVFLSRPKNLWQKTYHLQPLQTEVISFRGLLQDHVKDDHGRILPTNVLTGQVGWFTPGPGKVKGRILQSNRTLAMARNFSCTEGYSLAGALVTTNTTTMDAGDTVNFASVLGLVSIPVGGELGGCGGDPSIQGGSYSISWSSDTTNVAAISGSSSQSTVSVQGVSGGESFVLATLTDSNFGCTASDGAFAIVKPKVNSISPAMGLVGAGVPVTIMGAGFASGATVNAGQNITVSNVSVSSATKITATFTIANSAAAGGNHDVTVTVNGQASGAQGFFVQVPTSLSVLSVVVLPDGPSPPAGCPGSLPYGIIVDVTYKVLDQGGVNAIQSATMTPHESGTFFTGGNFDNNIGPVPGYPTSSAMTASDGTFHDVPVGICRNLPISNPGLTGSQNITVILPGGISYPVRSHTITVKAPGAASFEHGTMANSLGDINATR